MKVLYDGRYIDLSRSGVGIYARDLLMGLGEPGDSAPWSLRLRGTGGSVPRSAESRTIRTRISYEAHPLGDLHLRWALPRWSRSRGFDLLHAPGPYLPGCIRGIRCVATLHDLTALTRPQDLGRRFRLYMAAAIRRAFHQADGLVFDTDWIRREVEERLGPIRQPWVVAGGSVPSDFSTHPRPSAVLEARRAHGLPEEYILFVGDPEPRKNLAGVLAAYQRARSLMGERLPDLVVVGRRSKGSEEVTPEGVRRMGYVERHHLRGFYAGAQMLVYPSLYEGYGFPVLEAMASGCPVVTSRGTALEEVAGTAALLVDPRDPEELAEAIRGILIDRDLRGRLVETGRRRTERRGWEVPAERVRGLWHRLESCPGD